VRSRIAEGECVIGPRVPQGKRNVRFGGRGGLWWAVVELLNRNRHGRCAGA
jgi:hypothetical protein